MTSTAFRIACRRGRPTAGGWWPRSRAAHPSGSAGGWRLEPQAQLVYQTVDLDDTHDVGALSARTGDGLGAAEPVT